MKVAVEWKSTPATLQATLRATVSEATTWCNYPIARNVACNVASCGRALNLFKLTTDWQHSFALPRNVSF